MLDIGQDGAGFDANARFGRDAAALMLQYYQNDYRPIAGNNYYNLTSNSATDLYNGNISCLSTDYYTTTPLLKSFRYDKLNRIKQMQTAGVSGGEWGNLTDNFSTEYRYDYNGNILSLQRKDANAQIMHHINYAYNAKNNRLQGITATGINSSNYTYDAIGNLSNDNGENISVTWNAMNKVKQVNLPNNRQLQFSYSPTGQRQIKKSPDKTEYYLHDATGNIMCVYELSGNYLTVKERTIYGSKRIGVYRQRIRLNAFTGFGQAVLLPGSDLINILNPQPIISPDGRHYLEGSNRLQVIGVARTTLSVNTLPYAYKKGTPELKGLSPSIAVRPTFLDGAKTAGLRDYELTDHLSNVMAVISDRKLSVDTNYDNITDYYAPQVVSYTDYYPFGFPIAERSGNLAGYRFGFNGQEADGEVYGEKQNYSFEFRNYDSRLGRWWGVDLMNDKYRDLTPYSYCANNPVFLVDPDGKEWVKPEDKQKADELKEKAEMIIKMNNRLIIKQEKQIDKLKAKGGSENIESAIKKEELVNELKYQNKLLKEGIDVLNKMEAEEQLYTFTLVNQEESGVKKIWKGVPYRSVISIEYTSYPLAWHEKTHIEDYMKYPFYWGFDDNGYLGTKTRFRFFANADAEIHAYRSQYSLCKEGNYFNNVKRTSDINFIWLEINNFFKW